MAIENPPKENLLDKCIGLIKAGVDCAPGGSLVTGAFLTFIQLPYQKRATQWQQDVVDTLNKIEKGGIPLNELQNNEEFIDIVLKASLIGVRNSQEDKRTALKNAIYHSAQENAPDLSLQETFINCIDTFTVQHIKILYLFSNPQKWFSDHGKSLPGSGGVGSVMATLEYAFPELINKKSFVNYIWTDLHNRGFVQSNSTLLQTTMSSAGALDKRTTSFGDDFLNFIND